MPKTIDEIVRKKNEQKITVVTSYDYTMATLCDQVDILLVGDSAGIKISILIIYMYTSVKSSLSSGYLLFKAKSAAFFISSIMS